MSAYYNEHDPKAAAWLRELIKAKLIAEGDVDERDIQVVAPEDVRGFTQCHFFAGIGGWSYALRLAGWPDDRPVWTGSCPCQPFSSAGKGDGAADSRHLWPSFFRLIRECRPAIVFGEQVASADGRAWLDLVSTDVEATSYAIGAADLCAAGVGAPHIRQRLYFILADMHGQRCEGQRLQLFAGEPRSDGAEVGRGGEAGGLGDAYDSGSQRRIERWDGADQCATRTAGLVSLWSDCEWISCRDGKARPVEPGSFPLAHGIPARVGRLRGYGNAINPWVAKEFIQAYLDTLGE